MKSRRAVCIRLYAYFFVSLPPLFSKNFCVSYAIGILVAVEVEMLQYVARPAYASSYVLTRGLGQVRKCIARDVRPTSP